MTPAESQDGSDSVSITVIELHDQRTGKAVSMKTVFDDSVGINLEMKDDGVPVQAPGSSIVREMRDAVNAVEPDLGIMTGALGRERDAQLDRKQGVMEKVGAELDSDSFLRQLLYPGDANDLVVGKLGRFHLMSVLGSNIMLLLFVLARLVSLRGLIRRDLWIGC